mmetsp:Transcript_34/g.87  ORF Transcript_34/g.87 Transcript_34/m.87 type:complete len:311 (-) Transcript_34:315-1247(-)|eukprot:CAMPEP_0196664286 /NCGR_PEP_ID=MMETSP1086-20130531/56533_1 /TAXON_ID=77921 /ORGANISM="Cyanoptyche  gloeocystis , Strain SAG4.97" /LENGTH=310 /DNA_ID=CAMNT_0042000537 /DNA_START=70 /DNA_END=1002 /DNA_ORIENTATION=+
MIVPTQITADIAVIGGTGLYAIEGLEDIKSIDIDTPFGKTSDPIIVGSLEGCKVAFLARHGKGHRLLPSDVPYRANIYALKTLGVRWIISVSACGSLKEDYRPGDIVIPDGLFDHTQGRPGTFFGDGITAHVSLAQPFCPVLSEVLYKGVQAAFAKGATGVAGSRLHRGGNLIVMNGPRFSTKTESLVYRQWGMHLINMTTAPEAFLAREAEIAYAVMNHVTDYDCWHESVEAVTVEKVIQVLLANVRLAQEGVRESVKLLSSPNEAAPLTSPTWSALKDAILSRHSAVSVDVKRRLAAILQKYWGDVNQ